MVVRRPDRMGSNRDEALPLDTEERAAIRLGRLSAPLVPERALERKKQGAGRGGAPGDQHDVARPALVPYVHGHEFLAFRDRTGYFDTVRKWRTTPITRMSKAWTR